VPEPAELPRPLPPPSWRDRVDELIHGDRAIPRLAAGVLLVVGVAITAFVLLRPSTPSPPPELSLPMASASSPSTSATTTSATSLVVHAAGAVARPGLYRLPPGARVDDLVAAAGGVAADADVDRINLAAALVDGERVYVPRVGEAVPVAGDDAASSSGPIDLNTADESQLDSLPGVGPATAKAIIDERTRRGGRFTSVDDLLNVRGIGPAKLEQLRPLVMVR
jgi:competence protein ComEA